MSDQLLQFAPVGTEDFPILIAIMTRAFDEDTRMHTDRLHDGPKGYDDGTLLKKICGDSQNTARKILAGGEIIGFFSVIRDGTACVLNLFFLDPIFCGRGIGTRIYRMIEELFPNARRWTVETPEYSTRNLHFYIEKCGYVPIQSISDQEERSVLLEKNLP